MILRNPVASADMANLRKTVLDRLKELNWTRTKLVKELESRDVTPSKVYDWLNSKHDIGTVTADVICEVLHIEYVPRAVKGLASEPKRPDVMARWEAERRRKKRSS